MNQQPKQSSIDAETAIFAFDDATSKMINHTLENPARFFEEYRKCGYGSEKKAAPINFLFFGFLLGLDYTDYVISEVEKGSDE